MDQPADPAGHVDVPKGCQDNEHLGESDRESDHTGRIIAMENRENTIGLMRPPQEGETWNFFQLQLGKNC